MEGLLLQNITAGYGDLTIIKDLNLNVDPKTILVLMGVSGSGKTTLLKTILGIIKPTSGSINLGNQDISNLPIEKRNIGYLSQNYGLFPHMTVAENIIYGLRIRGIAQDEQKKILDLMLTIIEMKEYEKRNVLELSGGQQQRVGLARALAVKPDLFLLDEPLSNIDQATKFDVAADMKKLFDTLNIPIILVTHQYEDAQFFNARVAVMVEGKIEQIGSYEEIIRNPKTPFIKKLLTPFAVGN
jgi:ABC-type Fe3+/spermidine/putrescine transport system ATPase subunit